MDTWGSVGPDSRSQWQLTARTVSFSIVPFLHNLDTSLHTHTLHFAHTTIRRRGPEECVSRVCTRVPPLYLGTGQCVAVERFPHGNKPAPPISQRHYKLFIPCLSGAVRACVLGFPSGTDIQRMTCQHPCRRLHFRSRAATPLLFTPSLSLID
jgi:hypothetical protein